MFFLPLTLRNGYPLEINKKNSKGGAIVNDNEQIDKLKSDFGVTDDEIYVIMVSFMSEWQILVYCHSKEEAEKEHSESETSWHSDRALSPGT